MAEDLDDAVVKKIHEIVELIKRDEHPEAQFATVLWHLAIDFLKEVEVREGAND